MSGSPLRPDRDSFGPTVEDTSPVKDARRQWAARIANLLMWQVAGAGLVMPRIILEFNAQVSPTIVGRAEVWNPNRLSTGAYAPPGIVRQATGDYLVTYATPVPDEQGSDVAVSFTYAQGFCSNADPTVLKHVQAAVGVATNTIRVGVFNSAGALQDGNRVVLCGW